jgi:replicative DNA helicase
MSFEDLEAKYIKQAFQLPNINEEDEAFKLACEKKRAEEFETIFKYYPQWKQQAEKKQQMETEAIRTNTILKTSLPILDSKLKIFGKRLIMIIGRSGAGKTSFMAQMVRKNLEDNKRVLVFSCEEAGEDFIRRINFNYMIEDSMQTNFVMCDKGNITLEDIKLSVLKMDLMGIEPDIVYVDQLNKIKPEETFKGTKHEKIVHVSEQLQNLVKLIKKPLVILHQSNRATEQNPGFASQSNVADADAVYNEAQIVLFIESHDYFEWCKIKDPYRDVFKTYINVAKNRSVGGWTGAELCYFDRSQGVFLTEEQYN